MPTPSGSLSLPLKYMRDTLAASATFQTLVSALNATEALDSIFYVSTTTTTPPFAVVDWSASGPIADWDQDSYGARNRFEQTGSLEVILQAAVSSSTDAQESDEAITFGNTVGAIVDELLELAGQAAYLDITRVQAGPLMRPRQEEIASAGDFYQVVLTVEWRSFG